MDAVYVFRHSECDDLELRYSLRSVAEYLPWVRKVFVFGDRPGFLSEDTSRIEHVPWEAVAWVGGYRVPVTNAFLQYFLVSLWPELDSEFLIFHDDHILLGEVSPEVARRQRFVENLAECRERGTGTWKEQLWRTADWLKQAGYPVYNFESMTPRHMTKQRLFAAYSAFREGVSEDRFGGLLGPTAILNHAQRHEGNASISRNALASGSAPADLHSATVEPIEPDASAFRLMSSAEFVIVQRSRENLTVGFTAVPVRYDDIVEKTQGKRFLYFNEKGFSADMRRFLSERFPEPCVYENSTPREGVGSLFQVGEESDARLATLPRRLEKDSRPRPAGLTESDGRAGVPILRYDVVYLLAKSKWDQELKYSLRSFERFFPQLGTVWIVGYLPDYIDSTQVRHVPEPVLFRPGVFVESAAVRVLNDRLEGLTEDYILAQDDNYLLRPMALEDFGPFFVENLDTVKIRANNPWQSMLWRTYDLLKFQGFSGANYECHTPIRLTRSKFRDVAGRFLNTERAAQHRYHGVCLRSAYANILADSTRPPRRADEHRVGFTQAPDAATAEQITARLLGRSFLFHDDRGLTEAMKSVLVEMYPVPSRFELSVT